MIVESIHVKPPSGKVLEEIQDWVSDGGRFSDAQARFEACQFQAPCVRSVYTVIPITASEYDGTEWRLLRCGDCKLWEGETWKNARRN